MLSNDELLYDPEMDDDDERWVNSQRQRYQPAPTSAASDGGGGVRRLPHSDAVLNCPACMSLLCLDCQRSAFTHISGPQPIIQPSAVFINSLISE